MAKPLSFLAVPALMLALAAPALAADAPTADTVMATVNGTDITLGHMILIREGLPEQYDQIPDDVLFTGILDQLINQNVLMQSLAGDTPKRVTLSLDNERRTLMAATALDAALTAAVTDAAVLAAYDAKYAGGEPEREYHAAHILVETEDEAKALIETLKGGADFATLAKEKSTGPSGPTGGDLGWFGKGMMVAPFETAVIAMQDGDISAPVQTQFGWHVIKLYETRLAKAPPLDDVREELVDEIQTAAIEARIDELKAKAIIDRPDESGFDPAILKDTSLLED